MQIRNYCGSPSCPICRSPQVVPVERRSWFTPWKVFFLVVSILVDIGVVWFVLWLIN